MESFFKMIEDWATKRGETLQKLDKELNNAYAFERHLHENLIKNYGEDFSTVLDAKEFDVNDPHQAGYMMYKAIKSYIKHIREVIGKLSE